MAGIISIPAFSAAPDYVETRGRKRAYHDERAATPLERKRNERGKKDEIRRQNIAVLDMETDPFDAAEKLIVRPFAACLYADGYERVIWNEDFDAFVSEVFDAINELKEPHTIYAHNGGKFDFMFLIHKFRGKVSFKGRGIMSAKIGIHELRDSFHIIPERLANYKKDDFDYQKMRKGKRNKHKQEIIEYLVNDCKYLLEIVRGFVTKFGLKISIGQAAMYELKQKYKVGQIGENTDASLRQYFFGGRVECLAGRGHFVGDYNLYDVNSMYPEAMANYEHPISANYTLRRKGGITEKTVFIDVTCRNFGALVKRTEDNTTTATERHGRFLTTIWEFETALELGIIDRVKVHGYIDNDERSNFSDFVIPLYEGRQITKQLLSDLKKAGKEDSPEWHEAKKDDIFQKLLLNNAYGKFAQNPRRFKESFLTGPDSDAPDGYDALFPAFKCDDYAIWERPSIRKRFNNVGTAASITGAARSILMRAIFYAEEPIYCDTDSLICKKINNVEIHKTKLGAWDLEAEFSEVIIAGKKLYACKPREWNGQEKEIKVRSKGAAGLSWSDMMTLAQGGEIETINKAPTLTKTGKQFYMSRKIRATAPTLHIPEYWGMRKRA